METDKIIFGTDGWRGIIDDDVNDQTISLVAQAFADYLNRQFDSPSAAVSFDGRLKSQKFARIFAEILSGNSIYVYLSDRITPTPFLSSFVKTQKLSAGVMITASHNPGKYNGVKFKGSYGGPFFTEETLKVEKLLGSSSIRKNRELIKVVDLTLPYKRELLKLIDFDIIAKAGIKILIDSMAGAGMSYLQEFLGEFGIESSTIDFEPKPDFNGRSAEPIEQNLEPLKNILQNDHYSLGLATDGDADRLGVMFDNGEWLSAQETILYLADYLINEKNLPGDIVNTSSVTSKIRELFETESRKVKSVQVGFKFICEEMQKDQVAFGAEESGGFGYGDHMPERDGILSGLVFTEMLAASGYDKLSDYVEVKRKQFGEIFYRRIDLEYNREDRLERLPGMCENTPPEIENFGITKTEAYRSSRGKINGLKFFLDGKSRWILIRASETEPLIRIYAEGRSNDEVDRFLNTAVKIFRNS